jgi:hypothetical protein
MSIDLTVEVIIARPLEEVAAYVIDPSNEPEWISGIVESTPEMPGPIGVGSHVRRVAKFMGRRIEYAPAVLELEPHSHLLMRTDKPFPMTIDYRFSSSGGTTRFEQWLQGGPGGVMGLLDPLMAAMVRRNVRGDMQRLKAILESRA